MSIKGHSIWLKNLLSSLKDIALLIFRKFWLFNEKFPKMWFEFVILLMNLRKMRTIKIPNRVDAYVPNCFFSEPVAPSIYNLVVEDIPDNEVPPKINSYWDPSKAWKREMCMNFGKYRMFQTNCKRQIDVFYELLLYELKTNSVFGSHVNYWPNELLTEWTLSTIQTIKPFKLS